LLALPTLAAALCGCALFLIAPNADPAGLSKQLSDLITPEQTRRFLHVWWIHTGLYSGFAVGLAGMIAAGRRLGRPVT
jgi:hypothetical protein